MKYNTHIDSLYCILITYFFATSFALCIGVLFLNISKLFSLCAVIFFVLVSLICYLFCERYYIFNKNEYIVKVGFFKKKYKYKDIKKCFITKNNKLSYATSQKRICIKNKNKCMYISPENMEEVLLILINRRVS